MVSAINFAAISPKVSPATGNSQKDAAMVCSFMDAPLGGMSRDS
jgi:hypothetical protein